MSVERRGTKALELWAKRATQGYAGVSVENMTTSWRNGLAFCALIHHFRPDLIEFESLKAENVLENNALAYRVAEQHLGIPALLDAEDMLESLVPDRLSILTYVSQFYQAFGSSSVIKSTKESTISPNTKTNSPLTPQKTPFSSPLIVAAKTKLPTIPSKKETDFNTDKVATGGFKVKREECQGCHKPVFIAERILIGSPIQLRHRTCFRCARCTAQLTLANYYVTEKGQFCCETCPDEEKSLSLESSASKTDAGSSDSECDSTCSDSSINASLSSTADKSTVENLDSKPRTIFLNDTSTVPNTTEFDNRNDIKDSVIVDNSKDSSTDESLRLNTAELTNNSFVVNILNKSEDKCKDEESEINKTKKDTAERLYPVIDIDYVDSLDKNVDDGAIENIETTVDTTEEVENTSVSNSIMPSNAISKVLNSDVIIEELDSSGNETSIKKEIDGNKEDSKMDDKSTHQTSVEHSISNNAIYPDDLNPFGLDNEGEEEITSKTLNPFESSDEEKKSSNKNQNPFWSDDEHYLNQFPQTPSKSKSPPPRPPPPTLKRNEIPNGIIPIEYSLKLDHSGNIPSSPSSPAHSSRSDVPTLRIKKKQKPAPIPPMKPKRAIQMDKNLKDCLNDNQHNISKEVCDEVLSSKLKKEKRNQSSKMSENFQVRNTKFESGEWKRKKGPAPPRPVPQKRAIRALPMNQIQQELKDIEVKQIELERQGVIMETIIRSKTEREDDIETMSNSNTSDVEKTSTMSSESSHPGVEVEDLILQLFELVNEKNELFRKQTELMYLKREKRLEEEHAELEYQIRCSILKPNRTQDEILHEEELIANLMRVVEQRDQVVNCLELERQREAVEDESIATHMIKYQEKYIEGIDSNEETKRKKKKKKLRLLKKKKKKSDKETPDDADKDVDETEVKVVKKKKWFKKIELRPI